MSHNDRVSCAAMALIVESEAVCGLGISAARHDPSASAGRSARGHWVRAEGRTPENPIPPAFTTRRHCCRTPRERQVGTLIGSSPRRGRPVAEARATEILVQGTIQGERGGRQHPRPSPRVVVRGMPADTNRRPRGRAAFLTQRFRPYASGDTTHLPRRRSRSPYRYA